MQPYKYRAEYYLKHNDYLNKTDFKLNDIFTNKDTPYPDKVKIHTLVLLFDRLLKTSYAFLISCDKQERNIGYQLFIDSQNVRAQLPKNIRNMPIFKSSYPRNL